MEFAERVHKVEALIVETERITERKSIGLLFNLSIILPPCFGLDYYISYYYSKENNPMLSPHFY